MFKGLGNIAQLLKQAQNIGPHMQGVNEELKTKRITGTAGGGMVTVHANGLGHVMSIEVDETLREKNDLELVLDLLPAAVNDAVTKSRELHVQSMQSLTDGISLPGGLDDMLKQFSGQYAASPETDDDKDTTPPTIEG